MTLALETDSDADARVSVLIYCEPDLNYFYVMDATRCDAQFRVTYCEPNLNPIAACAATWFVHLDHAHSICGTLVSLYIYRTYTNKHVVDSHHSMHSCPDLGMTYLSHAWDRIMGWNHKITRVVSFRSWDRIMRQDTLKWPKHAMYVCSIILVLGPLNSR
jgi:hypothetical protein